MNLTLHYINYLRLEDSSIYAIERYYKNNPTDSQYTHQVNYKDGRAILIQGSSINDIPAYDSIF
ncbi:MAG: hypothetical protein U5L96_20500 [Owenweeksia sp.]|nr:hypothetical protein [Owenweeksia sp.]